MPRSRTTVIAVVAGVAAILVVVLAVAGLRSAGDAVTRGSCETTKGVVKETVPALERRFDLAELNYICQGNLAAITSDQAYLSFASARDYPSRSALAGAVSDELASAGWTARAGSARQLALRRDGASYEAVVTANSIAPALAIVRVTRATPSGDEGAPEVPEPLPEQHLTARQRLRYATIAAFEPRFVPAGYESWGNLFVADLDDVAVELTGGSGGVAPSLRSTARPKGYSIRRCNLFLTRSSDERCRLLGTTRSGIRVFIGRDQSAADGLSTNAVALLPTRSHPRAGGRPGTGDTVVTLLNARNNAGVKPALSRADVLRIFGSLRARNEPARR